VLLCLHKPNVHSYNMTDQLRCNRTKHSVSSAQVIGIVIVLVRHVLAHVHRNGLRRVKKARHKSSKGYEPATATGCCCSDVPIPHTPDTIFSVFLRTPPAASLFSYSE
jgi:hypothetical protein